MNIPVIEFFIDNVKTEEFANKRVLEVGSKYVNGSVRPCPSVIARSEATKQSQTGKKFQLYEILLTKRNVYFTGLFGAYCF